MVSCGKYNVRVWRIKANNLRSCVVDLHEHGNDDFTDISFEKTLRLKEDIQDCLM